MSTKQQFKISEVLDALGGRVLHGNTERVFSTYCIDSRYAEDGAMFVPLMGQSRDGHQFVLDAISKGAAAVVVRSGHHQIHEILEWLRERSIRGGMQDYASVCVIEVRHTLVALQKLAEWFRLRFDSQVVGITGSVGKTGTKEMLIQLLSTKYITVGTEKNFNNEIGVPLAISKINHRTKMTVIEMAMRARGEISLLSRIAHPDVAIITNTTGSHVGRLGSFDEIYKAKCEIVEGLRPGGTLILNRRDENANNILEEIRSKHLRDGEPNVLYFDASAVYANSALPPFLPPGCDFSGLAPGQPADIWIEDVKTRGLRGSEFTLCTKDDRVHMELNLLGRGAVENLAAAAAAAVKCGMSLPEIAQAAPNLLPAPQRLNLFQLSENLYLIDDCYNSSPASMQDSLELLLSVDKSFRKIAILGDMLELGKFETLLHRQSAQMVLSMPLDTVYAVGPRMNAVNEVEHPDTVKLFYIEGHTELESREQGGFSGMRFGESFGDQRLARQTDEGVILDDAAAMRLSSMLLARIGQSKKPTVVLIKGSRSLHLERVVNELLTGTNLQ